jgi:hypothetical protein
MRGMMHMRRVGVAAVTVALLGLGAAGCGSNGQPTPASTTEESIDQLNDDLGYGDDSDPFADESADDPTDEYPDTPKSTAFDDKAAAEGWEVEGYDQPSEYVLMMCESMDSWEPGAAQTLASGHVPDMTAGMKTALREGATPLCPKHAAEIKEALAGAVTVRTMSSGTYTIKTGAGLGGDVAPPGTYRSSGNLENCYWERAREDGTILDNHFATAAKELRVTVNPGELFTSRDCGTWALVK